MNTIRVRDGPEIEAGVLTLAPVSTLDDVMALRLLRNECRSSMTGSTGEITEAQQLAWWQNVAGNPNWCVWLVYVPSWDDPVGYALLRRAISYWYISLGLRTWMRGQGLGTTIYRMLEARCEGDVVAVIRSDNIASIRAAVKAGYESFPWTTPGQVALVGRKGARG